MLAAARGAFVPNPHLYLFETSFTTLPGKLMNFVESLETHNIGHSLK